MPESALLVRVATALVLTMTASCAHAPAPAVARTPSPDDLDPAATFASLVASVPRLVSASSRPLADCVVARDATAFPRLAAELAPAISPMPDALPDAIDAARDSDRVRLVSRYGVDGDAGPYVATFTHHRPPVDGFVIVVIVESEGVFLRSTRDIGPRDDGLSIPSAVERIREAARVSHPLVVVSGAPTTPLARIVALLEACDEVEAPFALGVTFTSTEPVSGRPAEEPSATGLCDALPALAGVARGSLSPTDVREAIQSLEAAFVACSSRGDPRTVARGGRLRLAVRIGEDGSVLDRCAVSDSMGDAAVRACILGEVERRRWPVPSPTGLVDVVFPLVIRPSTDGDHRATCGATPAP